jgi:hypothetical protein
LAEPGPYHLAQWEADSPAGTYPANMLFYQTAVPDPGLEAEMDSLWTLPYDLTGRSRINGLGSDGFAFINTANPQDVEGAGFVGAAMLALSTLGEEAVRVTWTGGTVIPNSRVYVTVLEFGSGPGDGSALYAVSEAAPRNLVALYEETAGATRPLAATVVEDMSAAVDSRYAGFYEGFVAGLAGRWGTLIPNALETGVQRIEERDLSSGEIVSLFFAPGGIRPTIGLNGGVNATGIRVPGPGEDGYAVWQARQFTLAELADESVSGPLADGDEGGLLNFLKFALGLNVFESSDGMLPAAELREMDGELFLSFQHRRLIGESGVIYTIEVSEDLETWDGSETQLVFLEAEPSGDGVTEIVTALLSIEAGAQRFVRLRAEAR